MKSKIIFFFLLAAFISKGQEQRASFGIQYKPIIPSKYFNSSYQNSSQFGYDFKLSPQYSNSLGMIIRYKISNIFWFENALNYTNRNYNLELKNNNISVEYLDLRSLDTLEELVNINRPCGLFIACYIDGIRLIDNIEI